jgi:pyridoxal/pyridoxine/pyridoxamine kinase
MVVDPGTAMLIATAVATAAKGAGDYMAGQSSKKSAKRRSLETKRETQAALLENALTNTAELEGHRLGTRKNLAKRKTQSLQDTSDLVRGAFNI